MKSVRKNFLEIRHHSLQGNKHDSRQWLGGVWWWWLTALHPGIDKALLSGGCVPDYTGIFCSYQCVCRNPVTLVSAWSKSACHSCWLRTSPSSIINHHQPSTIINRPDGSTTISRMGGPTGQECLPGIATPLASPVLRPIRISVAPTWLVIQNKCHDSLPNKCRSLECHKAQGVDIFWQQDHTQKSCDYEQWTHLTKLRLAGWP